MFDPASGPRVFVLPAGADFAGRVLDGLAARMAGLDPFARAAVDIRLNTRRAQRVLEERMARDPRFAGLMPRIAGAEDLLRQADGPRAVDPLRRKLHLARLIAGLLAREPGLAPRGALFDLAARLADLLDTFQGEGVAPDRLDTLRPQEVAAHWEISARFMRLLWTAWPEVLAELEPGLADPEVARMAQVEALARDWAARPPAHPVILAGSTGSRPWMRRLMGLVADLPQGAVILPGVDRDLPVALWGLDEKGEPCLTPDHPQAGLAATARALGCEMHHLPSWAEGAGAGARGRLISLALRPAPVTDSWLAEAPARAGEVAEATGTLSLIVAPAEREEAAAIACAMRDAVERGLSVALITPDRDLSRRVAAALDRWHIVPDDSAGRPLHLTPPGVVLRLLLDMAGRAPDPSALIALLKHPLIGGAGEARRLHLRRVIGLQTGREVLATPVVDWPRIMDWAAGRQGDEAATAWAQWLERTLAGLTALDPAEGPVALIGVLRRTAEALSRGLDGDAPEIWRQEAGLAALTLLDRLEAAGDAMAGLTQGDAIRLVTDELIAAQVRSAAFLPHPGVLILGALEARMTRADITILGGLNEGVWPERPAPDPWLNRTLRRTLDLPMPERETGLSAHDFQNAVSAPRVILSRAARAGGAPTVASRWLIRLTNLVEGLGAEGTGALKAMQARGQAHLARAAALERPAAPTARAPRPNPAPPVGQRLTELPVTAVETLIRDPYATYARYILGLRPLDLPGRDPDALERGNALHKVMERFAPALGDVRGQAALDLLERIAREELDRHVPWPATRALWLARLMRVAPALVEGEAARQADARPLMIEARGARDMAAPPFRLTAKADRIDRAEDGTLRIYDYKSGTPPSDRQIRAFALQLPLTAEIARAGGFPGIDPAEVTRLDYIGLGSGAIVRSVVEGVHEQTARAWERLATLIGAHCHPAMGFMARQRPSLLSYASDYDHLSRHGEWEDGDPAPVQEVGR